MSNATSNIPQDVGKIAGPLLLGYLFNWALMGTLTVQVYLYYISFPRDKLASKLLVAFVFVWELVQTILSTHDAFKDLGSGWGNVDELNKAQWLWFSVPIMSGVVSCTVQNFYAWRIYVISGSPFIALLIVALACTEGVVAILNGVGTLKVQDLSLLQDRTFPIDALWLGCSSLCDVIIASAMMFYLWKGKTKFHQTRILISRIIGLAVGSGIITATVALLDLSLFLAFRKNNYHFTPALCLAKLYSNSLMVQFNFRIRIVGARGSSMEDGSSGVLGGVWRERVDGNAVDFDLLSYENHDRHSASVHPMSPTRGSTSISKWKRRQSVFRTSVPPSAHNRRTHGPRSTFFRRFNLRSGRNDSGTFPLDGISVSVTTQTHKDTDDLVLPNPSDSSATVNFGEKPESWDRSHFHPSNGDHDDPRPLN